MKYLLDSHILIWALFADEKLPGEAYAIVNDPKNEIYYSAASVWEVGIKHSKSPEKIPVSSQLLTEGCDMAGMISPASDKGTCHGGDALEPRGKHSAS